MKKLFYLITMFFIFSIVVKSENSYVPSIDWHGFVKTDIIYDTRQVVSAREGHFHIIPKDEELDNENDDINATPSFNILSIQTRLNGRIQGPSVAGFETSGFIEGAFFGTSNGDVNGFRLRHAFVDIAWTDGFLRVGQYWHPMFVTQVFPDVVNFNTGVPFQPFSRNPQIRLSQNLGGLAISLTALSQRDFVSYGPIWNGASYDAVTGSQFLRNAGIPEFDLQLSYSNDNFIIGATGSYKTLRPEIKSSRNYINENTISSIAAQGFMKIKIDPVTVKLQGIYGQNMSNLTMLGGYAAKDWDPVTGIMEYTNNNIISSWGEINFRASEDITLNLFAGYTKNLGYDDDLNNVGGTSAVFARAPNVESAIRVSPYVRWNIGKVQIAGELEYTSVAYGDIEYADKGKVKDTHDISNLRSLIAVYIFF